MGSGVVFEGRGIYLLRGLPEEIHLHGMRAAGDATKATIISLENRMLS